MDKQLDQARSEPSIREVPNSFRTALNQYCYPAISPTFEVWVEAIRAGLLLPAQLVTIAILLACAKRLGRNVSPDTIKEGLKHGTGYFWGVVQTSSGVYFSGQDGELSSPCKTPSNKTGRRPTTYQLFAFPTQRQALLNLARPRIFEAYFPASDPLIAPIKAAYFAALGFNGEQAANIANQLLERYSAVVGQQPALKHRLEQARAAYKRLVRDLENRTSTPLPAGWTYRNASEYVALVLRAQVEANPTTQRSRRQIARTVGRSERNVDAILARAGVVNQPQVVERTIPSLNVLDSLAPSYDQEVQGYPVTVVSIRGETVATRRFTPQARAFVERELQAGAEVVLRYQQASLQVVVTDGQPEPQQQQKYTPKKEPLQTTDGKRTQVPYFGSGYSPIWALAWFLKLLAAVTEWRQAEAGLVHRVTGEIVPCTVQTVLNLLLPSLEEPLHDGEDFSRGVALLEVAAAMV